MGTRTVRTLKAWRAAHPYSLRELARAAGVATATIQEVEAGRRAARPSTVRRVSAALGVAPAQVAEFRAGLGIEDDTEDPDGD